MRSLLLATTAIAVIGAHSAMAADVLVSTTLAESCSATADPSVDLPASGVLSAVKNFSYQCNFGGEGADATLTFDSLNGGVGGPANPYFINPNTGPSGSSAVPLNHVVGIPAANTAYPATFTLQLQTPIIVAGTYNDTLAITIAP